MKKDYLTVIEEKRALLESVADVIRDTIRQKEYSMPTEWDSDSSTFIPKPEETWSDYEIARVKSYDIILETLEKLIK